MRIRLLAFLANVLGVQFKIDGLPYGASYERSAWMRPPSERNTRVPARSSQRRGLPGSLLLPPTLDEFINTTHFRTHDPQ